MKTIAFALILAGSGWGLTTFWNQQTDIDRTVPAAVEGIVVVRVQDGRVAIEGWDRNEVRVTGVVDGDPDRLEIIARNGYVDVRVIPELQRSVRAELTVRVPVGSSLDVETTGASIAVKHVEGMVRMASVDGRLTLAGTPLGFVARSERGDIDLSAEGVPGLAHSVDGTVTLSGRPADRATDGTPCNRPGACYRFGQTHLGRRDLGRRIESLVQSAVRGLDVSGVFDFEPRHRGFDMHVSADFDIDAEEMERFFSDLELVMHDVEFHVTEGMAVLADELEHLGETLRQAGERHRRHDHSGKR